MHTSLRILLALPGFIACALGVGMTVQWAASSLPVVVSYVLAGLAVSASVFGLVHALRRHVDREPMDLVRFDRTTAPSLVLGIVVALVVAVAGSAISVWLGFAEWGAPPLQAFPGLAAIIVTRTASVLLVQGFQRNSVIFGSIHVVSNGGASAPTRTPGRSW